MDDRARSPLRLLAPVALIVATLAFFVILTGSGDDEGQSAGGGTAAQQTDTGGERKDGGSEPETYEVQSGDTLDAISAETGVSVEQIQALNPDLDPQSLIAGQELKLSD
jgi:LysM repeat protein